MSLEWVNLGIENWVCRLIIGILIVVSTERVHRMYLPFWVI